MKIMKLLLIGLVFLVSVSMSYAVPEIAYTNFARTAGGNLVIGPPATVDVRITILNSGVQVYQEIHQDVPTNGYGLFTVKLGTGTPVGLDTYSSIVAVNTLNVQAETDAGDGYRFVQLSPLLNTALKNEEAAGIVTLNDAYLNGDSIEVLPGMPIKLQGTGLIQSDATIAAINSNNKNLTTKEYVDNGIANVADNPFLVYQDAAAELPNSKILNGEAGVINFNAATANLSIINEGISEAKLKIPTAPVNGYILKWNGSDMTWADPTVITAAPVSGDGTALNPITLDYVMPFILNGANLDLKKDATLLVDATNGLGINLANPNSWTGLQTFANVDINGGTIDGTVIGATTPASGKFTSLVVNTTAAVGTDLTVGGNAVITGNTTSALFIGKLDKQITGGNGLANLTFDNTADVAFAVNVDNSTLEINADTLRVKANGITTLELAPNAVITENILDGNVTEPKLAMTNDTANGLYIRWNTTAGGLTWEEAVVNTAAPVSGNGSVANPITLDYVMPFILNGTDLDLEYDATLLVDATTGLGFDHNHMNTWLTTQTFEPTTDVPAIYTTNSGYFNKTSTTATPFAIQGWAKGSVATLPDFPTVAQGNTGIGQYIGAAPSTNMVIGSVGLAYAGPGIIAIGTYGGARENNPVANVGTVGHAVIDASGNNHGIFGMASLNASGQAEVGTALALGINSGVTGINLGVNANDWAGYFVGNVKATKYYGALQYSIIDGPGIKDFTFNNSGNATVEVEYDSTLVVDPTSDKLGIDLNQINNWTATQFLPANAAQGNNLVAAVNMAADNTLEADVLMYDATLEVNGNNLGFNHDHQNTWLTSQFFAPVPDQPAVVITGTATGEGLVVDGQLTVNTATVVAVGSGAGDANIDFMFQDGDMDLMGSLSVSDNTTTNTLDVTTTANVGTDLTVGNDAAVGGNLVVTGTTTSALFIGETNFDIQDGAGIADFTFNNLADAVVSVNVAAPIIIDVNDNVTLDYDDVTLEVGVDGLAIDLDNSNIWTATQFLPANADQGNNLVAAVNMALDESVNGEVINIDNTLLVNPLHELGFNHEWENTWKSMQSFIPNSDEPAVVIDGLSGGLTFGTPTLVVTSNGILGDDDFIFEGQMFINEDLTVVGTTITENLTVNTDASVGNDLDVIGNTTTGSLDVTNNANVGGDFDVTGNTTLDGHVTIGSDNADAVVFNAQVDSDIVPDENNVHSLGSSTLRWNDLYLGPGTLHIGNDLDEGTISYDVANNQFVFDQDVDVNADMTANTYTGQLVNNLQDGAGIADFTYDNSVNGITISVDRDSTLLVDPITDKLGIDLNSSNEWTAIQSFTSSNISVDAILDPIVAITGGLSIVGTAGDADFVTYTDVDLFLDGDALIMGKFRAELDAEFAGSVNVDLDANVTGTLTAGTLNGGYTAGSVLFADASGNITENNNNLLWNNTTNSLNLDGNIDIVGGSADPEIRISGGQGINLNTGATLTIEDYSYPVAAGNPTEFLALNDAADELVWWTYDNTIAVDTTNHVIGLNQNAPFSFTNIVAFNPTTGPAATFTSVDSTEATVKIENTDKQGVALELIGKTEETTALEITTGGLNIGAGQFIVSSNSGVTGVEPNGPSVTINNNGDGATENGGALEILVGHTTFSYGNYAPGNNFAVDLSGEPYTVLDVESDGTNAVTLPGTDMAATKAGTIIYVINSGTGTLTLPGTLGSVNAGTSAQLVYTAAGWFRLN